MKKTTLCCGLLLLALDTHLAAADVYPLASTSTQCYVFSRNRLQTQIPCVFQGNAYTGKVWWVQRDFRLKNGQQIVTIAKDTQRKYLAKGEKILMPVTVDGNPAQDMISLATLNGKPAIRQNRSLNDYHVMREEEFWDNQTQLLPSQMTDRLACLQVEDQSLELCTPYHDNDFRTD